MKHLTFILLLLLLVYPAYALEPITKKVTLLAVSETPNGYEGSTAVLELEVTRGSGRVFLDTSPASKLDTQLSTRFAKEIACNFLDESCENYDFFYTIKADTTIVGGPSAGAAIAVVTVAALKDIDLNDKVAISGTINSGALIGPVGGLKEKVEAAAGKGLKKVLIPLGKSSLSRNPRNLNFSLNLIKYGAELGVEVVEVNNLNDALFEFSNMRLKEDDGSLEVDKVYQDTMRALADYLCQRSKSLKANISKINKWNENLQKEKVDAENLTTKSLVSYNNKDYYSAASFCFGANVRYNHILLSMQGLDRTVIREKVLSLKSDLDKLENSTNERNISTLTDLQTFLVVAERILEARRHLEDVNFYLKIPEKIGLAVDSLALAEERYISAKSWSSFFGKSNKLISFNKERLKESCELRIRETEQRIEYSRLFVPDQLADIQIILNDAKNKSKSGDYGLCLYRASLAKARSNVVLSVIGSEDKSVVDLVQRKIEAAKQTISKQISKGFFPIIGYSYYKYSQSLLDESNKYSALIYAEYALELSDLDPYFKQNGIEHKQEFQEESIEVPEISVKEVLIFLIGIFLGYVLNIAINYKTLRKAQRPCKGKKR